MQYTSLKINSDLLFQDKHEEINRELKSFFKDLKIAHKTVVQITCHAAIRQHDDYEACANTLRTALDTLFNSAPPATTLIAQEPAKDTSKVLFRIGLCRQPEAKVEHKVFQKHPYTLLSIKGEKMLFSGGINGILPNDMLRNIQSVYDFAEQLLDHEEMHFGHIAVESNFVEDINGKENAATGWNNKQALEEIRRLYFDPTLFQHGTPLEQTAGIDSGTCLMDFIAMAKDGFPGAQLSHTESTQDITRCAYLPQLKKVFIGHTNDGNVSSASDQLKAAVGQIETLMNNTQLTFASYFDEVKLTLPENNETKAIIDKTREILKTNRLTIVFAPLKNKQVKLELEVIATVS
ncbi:MULTISPECIES: hypothetical protein [unclassified Carboxylicivirga]|uniref:hypothetical protein n=1 Tax=Carboxylicivirga TaxID=1628153 RepID=UPI003D335233